MKKIYVVGNLFLKEDSLPLKIMPLLAKKFPEIKFIEFDPTENFPKEKNILILDTVAGLKKACLISDISEFEFQKPYSLHDFDLGLNLKLMQKIGYIKKFTIVGVPQKISKKEAIIQVSRLIKSLL
jgi:Ni,Fe-hydrogenase maturation factor